MVFTVLYLVRNQGILEEHECGEVREASIGHRTETIVVTN